MVELERVRARRKIDAARRVQREGGARARRRREISCVGPRMIPFLALTTQFVRHALQMACANQQMRLNSR